MSFDRHTQLSFQSLPRERIPLAVDGVPCIEPDASREWIPTPNFAPFLFSSFILLSQPLSSIYLLIWLFHFRPLHLSPLSSSFLPFSFISLPAFHLSRLSISLLPFLFISLLAFPPIHAQHFALAFFVHLTSGLSTNPAVEVKLCWWFIWLCLSRSSVACV